MINTVDMERLKKGEVNLGVSANQHTGTRSIWASPDAFLSLKNRNHADVLLVLYLATCIYLHTSTICSSSTTTTILPTLNRRLYIACYLCTRTYFKSCFYGCFRRLQTSIMAVAFKGGVVIGADSRTTTGSYIVSLSSPEKLYLFLPRLSFRPQVGSSTHFDRED